MPVCLLMLAGCVGDLLNIWSSNRSLVHVIPTNKQLTIHTVLLKSALHLRTWVIFVPSTIGAPEVPEVPDVPAAAMDTMDRCICTVCEQSVPDWMCTEHELPGFRPFKVRVELCPPCARNYLHSAIDRRTLQIVLLLKLATLNHDALLEVYQRDPQ